MFLIARMGHNSTDSINARDKPYLSCINVLGKSVAKAIYRSATPIFIEEVPLDYTKGECCFRYD